MTASIGGGAAIGRGLGNTATTASRSTSEPGSLAGEVVWLILDLDLVARGQPKRASLQQIEPIPVRERRLTRVGRLAFLGYLTPARFFAQFIKQAVYYADKSGICVLCHGVPDKTAAD